MSHPYKNVPVRPATWKRLRSYKMGGATFDDVLNNLMDAVPLERVADKVVREARRRLKNFQGTDWREVRKSLGDG